jgi:hypothetical protein
MCLNWTLEDPSVLLFLLLLGTGVHFGTTISLSHTHTHTRDKSKLYQDSFSNLQTEIASHDLQIYIHRELEREREREGGREGGREREGERERGRERESLLVLVKKKNVINCGNTDETLIFGFRYMVVRG